MILEMAILIVKPRLENQFEADFRIASKYISAIDGYVGHSLQKCMEQNNKYVLLVEWNKLEDHIIGFRQSAAYIKWKELLHHYYDPFPTVAHYETIFENKN